VEKVKVKLIGEDGNVFNIIGKVSKALKRNGESDKSAEYTSKAFSCETYDEVLALTMEYVDVE
jgi:hypothetical protein